MNRIYQPIIVERANEIIETLIDDGFFEDYEITNLKFAKKHLCDKITEKFIIGDFNDDDWIFTEDEMLIILRELITGSILYELKEKGLVNSYEDESTDEMFFLTKKGKRKLKNDKNLEEN